MNKHNQDFYLRTSDFDLKKRQHPASVLDLFQEAAGCHAAILGCDFDRMMAKNLLWMVTRVRYTVVAETSSQQTVTMTTWPLPPARVIFQREYDIRDDKGNQLIKGSSEWAVVDCNTRRFASANGVYPEGLDHCLNRQYESRLPRLHDFESEGEGYTVTPGYSDIDTNGHVNNTKYANFVMNAVGLGNDEHICDFQIDYHKEVQCGDPLTIFNRREGKEIMAKGVNQKGDMMFLCRIEIS